MLERRIVVGGGPLVTMDPALRVNPQGDILVEARIGRWVIICKRRYGPAMRSQ